MVRRSVSLRIALILILNTDGRYSQLMSAFQRMNGWMALVQSACDFLSEQGLVTSSFNEAGQQSFSWTGQEAKDIELILQEYSALWLQQQLQQQQLLQQQLQQQQQQQQVQQQHQHPQQPEQLQLLDRSIDGTSSSCRIDVEGTASDLNDSMLNSPSDAALSLGPGLGELGDEFSDVGCSATFFDSTDVVHPPRCITTWTVRPSSEEEKADYRVGILAD